MDKISLFFVYLAVTAGVTYLVRMLPLVFFRKKIKSRFIKSFLYYVPYSVLTVMTVPDIFYSTSYILSGIIGTAVAILLASRNKGLLIVAAGAALSVLLSELLLPYVVPTAEALFAINSFNFLK